MLRTTSYEQLDTFFQRKFDTEFASRCKSLRSTVSDTSKWESNFDLTRLKLPSHAKKKNEMIKLCLIHWYFPEEVRFLFRLWLEENMIVEYKEVFELLLVRKEVAIGWLLVQDEMSDSDLWGNLLCPKRPLLSWFNSQYVKFEFKTRKAKKVQRHRGYRDKGTLRFPHQTRGINVKTYREEWLEEFLDCSQQLRKKVLLNRILERLEQENVS